MVPFPFITRPTCGLVPGVSVTLPPITAGSPSLTVSLTITDGVLPPEAGTLVGPSFSASMVGAMSVT
jgi:hypothetical protein